MDPLGAFKSEVFRPIASIVLPGMVALSAFTVVAANAIPELSQLFTKQPAVFLLLFTAAATVVGMLLENIGMSIERGIDRCMEVEYLPGSDAVWERYLALGDGNSNARRYLSTLVTRLKFINAMIPACVSLFVVLIVLKAQLARWDGYEFFAILLLLAIVTIWLFRTSTELSEAALFSRFKMLPDGAVSLDTNAGTPFRLRHLAYVLVELRSSRSYEMDFSKFSWTELGVELCKQLVVAIPSERAKATPSPAPSK